MRKNPNLHTSNKRAVVRDVVVEVLSFKPGFSRVYIGSMRIGKPLNGPFISAKDRLDPKVGIMKVAFGMKAHSGWAALVVVGTRDDDFAVVDRRRIELVEDEWAKQPYHAAENMEAGAARDLVERGIETAQRIAVRELRAAVKREQERKNEVTACAVLVGNPMPDWSIAEILAVHFRMHKAEGFLFRDALVQATKAHGLRLVAIPEKLLTKHAGTALGSPVSRLEKKVAALGKSVGPPWGKDQKDAALAAMIALHEGVKVDAIKF